MPRTRHRPQILFARFSGVGATHSEGPGATPALFGALPTSLAVARSTARRSSASLIGCLGQAHFPSSIWGVATHPGHASLRSLGDALWAPLHACVGLAVESLALRRASRCAAANFGFIHEPRPVRTTPSGFGVGLSDHAMPSTFSGRNSVPSAHMRCSRTASLRATATTARRRPLVRIKRIPHVLICDPAIVRMSSAFAAA